MARRHAAGLQERTRGLVNGHSVGLHLLTLEVFWSKHMKVLCFFLKYILVGPFYWVKNGFITLQSIKYVICEHKRLHKALLFALCNGSPLYPNVLDQHRSISQNHIWIPAVLFCMLNLKQFCLVLSVRIMRDPPVFHILLGSKYNPEFWGAQKKLWKALFSWSQLCFAVRFLTW